MNGLALSHVFARTETLLRHKRDELELNHPFQALKSSGSSSGGGRSSPSPSRSPPSSGRSPPSTNRSPSSSPNTFSRNGQKFPVSNRAYRPPSSNKVTVPPKWTSSVSKSFISKGSKPLYSPGKPYSKSINPVLKKAFTKFLSKKGRHGNKVVMYDSYTSGSYANVPFLYKSGWIWFFLMMDDNGDVQEYRQLSCSEISSLQEDEELMKAVNESCASNEIQDGYGLVFNEEGDGVSELLDVDNSAVSRPVSIKSLACILLSILVLFK